MRATGGAGRAHIGGDGRTWENVVGYIWRCCRHTGGQGLAPYQAHTEWWDFHCSERKATWNCYGILRSDFTLLNVSIQIFIAQDSCGFPIISRSLLYFEPKIHSLQGPCVKGWVHTWFVLWGGRGRGGDLAGDLVKWSSKDVWGLQLLQLKYIFILSQEMNGSAPPCASEWFNASLQAQSDKTHASSWDETWKTEPK